MSSPPSPFHICGQADGPKRQLEANHAFLLILKVTIKGTIGHRLLKILSMCHFTSNAGERTCIGRTRDAKQLWMPAYAWLTSKHLISAYVAGGRSEICSQWARSHFRIPFRNSPKVKIQTKSSKQTGVCVGGGINSPGIPVTE